MCGLTGIAGPGIQFRDIDILRDLAYISGLRGRDGAGIVQGGAFKWGKQGSRIETELEKTQFDISHFMNYHRFADKGNKKIFTGVTNNFFCVHTRGASRGTISHDNAHPFEFDKLIGMHNGTMADPKYIHFSKTDSELFIKDMNDRGVKEVLKNLHPVSAYALVMIDKETGELIFTRNEKRSLYFAFAKDRAVMYWASEGWMIKDMCMRNNTELLGNTVGYFKPFGIHRIHPSEVKAGNDKVWSIEKFVHVAPKTISYTQRGNWDDIEWMQGPRRNSLPVIVDNTKKKEERPVQELKKGELIPHKYCCGCQKKLSLVEQYFAQGFNENTLVCSECEKDILLSREPEQKTEKEETHVHVG